MITVAGSERKGNVTEPGHSRDPAEPAKKDLYMTSYPGGKNRDYQTLINMIPPHDRYIEPFLGSGAVMRHKRAARLNIGWELDHDAIRAFRSFIANTDDGTRYEVQRNNALFCLSPDSFKPNDFMYLDPPYLMGTRLQHRQIYRYELTDADHVWLLQQITRLPCMVMISGYWSEMYAEQLSNWRVETFTAWTRGGQPATEHVWMNYPKPTELHDYSYLGDDFRERERIQRKVRRWVRGLKKLPQLERLAIIAGIDEAYRPSSPEATSIERCSIATSGDASASSEVAMKPG